MRELYQFMGEHPVVSVILGLGCLQAVVHLLEWPFRLINRCIRSRNIKNAGWPPKYLDADGDQIVEDEPLVIAFKATTTNTGPVTMNGTVLHLTRNGKPLRAGDIAPGEIVTIDWMTGEVSP